MKLVYYLNLFFDYIYLCDVLSRFLDITLTSKHNVTSGKIYKEARSS